MCNCYKELTFPFPFKLFEFRKQRVEMTGINQIRSQNQNQNPNPNLNTGTIIFHQITQTIREVSNYNGQGQFSKCVSIASSSQWSSGQAVDDLPATWTKTLVIMFWTSRYRYSSRNFRTATGWDINFTRNAFVYILFSYRGTQSCVVLSGTGNHLIQLKREIGKAKERKWREKER